MIVLEGVDKSGKTTLFTEIFKKRNVIPHHFGIPKGDPTFDYQRLMEESITPLLLDRFFYGELPYSIVKKRAKYMTDLALRCLQLMMQTFPHLVIYMRPRREVVLERLMKDGDDYVDAGEVNRLYDEYDQMFNLIFNATFLFDPDRHDIDSFTPHLDQALDPKAWEFFHRWKSFDYPGTGALDPRYLFVGERFNRNSPHQVTFWSNAGKYLFECLDLNNVDMRLCHFTNAVHGFDTYIPQALIEFLKPRVIICLGDVAWANITKMKMPYPVKLAKVPHPAYYSRFHSDKKQLYCHTLEEACTL
jgi:hypothetical protein